MTCPHCGQSTTDVGGLCHACHQRLSEEHDQVSFGLLMSAPASSSESASAAAPAQASHSSSSDQARARPAAALGPLVPGQAFGKRYHIIRLLGAGGMGAVYQAWDDELGLSVAIKVIRPEVTSDPTAAAEVERRFKRELLLARQVTHKHVVRIYDLGEIDGIKYITMPYIQGVDLATMLKRSGRLSVPIVLQLAKQIAAGLQAAHEAGVVHRDLKPANVMVEDDQATIMDFGIARSTSGGMTRAGAVVGTLEYMAPEQARGQVVDHRVDIYAFGMMLYDMLTGLRRSSGAETAVAELMRRMQQAPPPLRTVNPEVPEPLARIIDKCVQPDPAKRYPNTKDLAADLDRFDAAGHSTTEATPPQPAAATAGHRIGPRTLVALSVLVVAIIAAGVLFTPRADRRTTAVLPARQVSAAVVPFRNASGDATLEWLGQGVAELLSSELGQSRHLRTLPPGRMQQILAGLGATSGGDFDPATLRRVADYGGADTVIWGQYLRFGREIRIDASVEDLKERRSFPVKAQAADEDALMRATGDLAEEIRIALGFSPETLADLRTRSGRPSTQSGPALRFYIEGVQLVRQGKPSEALERLRTSTQVDSRFALAFSRLALTHFALQDDAAAQRASQQAVDLSSGLPPDERFAILANHATIGRDDKAAVDHLESWLRASPDHPEVQFELAQRYHAIGQLDRAQNLLARVVEHDPKSLDALLALGRVESERNSPQASLEFLNRALSAAIQLNSDQGRARVLRAIGALHLRLGSRHEALRSFNESLEIERRRGDQAGIAESESLIRQVESKPSK